MEKVRTSFDWIKTDEKMPPGAGKYILKSHTGATWVGAYDGEKFKTFLAETKIIEWAFRIY